MSEKRQHLRLPLESTTFIELESPGIGDNDSGKLVTCKTLNVSRRGLLVSLDQEVTIGAILQIGVDLPGPQETLYLAGEVRWCLPSEIVSSGETGWHAGFQLHNAGDTDIDQWIALILGLESEIEPE